MRSGFDIADRSKFAYKSRFFLVNVGYRVGSFIPTLGMSSYSESTPFPNAYAAIKTAPTQARFATTSMAAPT